MNGRSCYFIPPQDGLEGFIPAYVEEGVKGYRMMPRLQLKRGITPEVQQEIILSSMP